MPAYQGEYDGLCGMYAIANAYAVCDYKEDFCAELFQVACGALPQRRWPSVLWKGTDFADMKKMVRACRRYEKDKSSDSTLVSDAFFNGTPPSNEAYWRRFDEIFRNENVRCGIVGRTEPSPHWIVIDRDTIRRVWFSDSDVNRPEFRKNVASLYAGQRRRSQTQWRLCREELLVFYETNNAVSSCRGA